MKTINEKIIDYIKNHQGFLIITHQKPDGDAIGSSVALGKGLKKIGKKINYFIQMPIEQNLNLFDEIQTFNKITYEEYDAVIAVDCSTWSHTYRPKQMPKFKELINIDHHITNEGYGNYNHIENVSANAELIYRLLDQLNIPLDEEMADALYTGISTDTGSFQFSNVTSETHEIAAQLYKYPFSYAELSRKLHHEKSIEQFKLYGIAVQNIKLINHNTISWTLLDYSTIQQYGGDINISDDIANIGVNIKGVDVAITLKEVEKKIYRVSLRANSECALDVSKIAKFYGGGGHDKAAGFTYRSKIEILLNKIVGDYNIAKDKRNRQQ